MKKLTDDRFDEETNGKSQNIINIDARETVGDDDGGGENDLRDKENILVTIITGTIRDDKHDERDVKFSSVKQERNNTLKSEETSQEHSPLFVVGCSESPRRELLQNTENNNDDNCLPESASKSKQCKTQLPPAPPLWSNEDDDLSVTVIKESTVDVVKLQDKVLQLESKLATLSHLLSTGKLQNNIDKESVRYPTKKRHESRGHKTRKFYVPPSTAGLSSLSSHPLSIPPPPLTTDSFCGDDLDGSNRNVELKNKEASSVTNNGDNEDTMSDQESNEEQNFFVESPLGQASSRKSAIPYLESPSPWDSAVDGTISEKDANKNSELDRKAMMLDIDAGETSDEREALQPRMPRRAMLGRKRLSYLLLDEAMDEGRCLNNTKNAITMESSGNNFSSTRPDSSTYIVNSEKNGMVNLKNKRDDVQNSTEITLPPLQSKSETSSRSQNNTINQSNTKNIAITVAQTLTGAQTLSSSYNSLLFDAIIGGSTGNTFDNYFTNVGKKNCKVRNKWLDHLNSYQESNRDIDAQMQEFTKVPGCVESLLGFGLLICIDSFLYVCTILPLRFVWSCLLLLLCSSESAINALGYRKNVKGKKTALSSNSNLPEGMQFHRRHLYQLIQVGIIWFVSKYVLGSISIGKLYHWIRGQNMIKSYVLIAMVDVFDRLMCSLGQDCFDSMYWNTTRRPRSTRLYISIMVVIIYTTIHSLLLFVHIATLNVAMNSNDQALLGLLIGGNFAEVKSTVFKKYNKPNLFKITTSDICERFKIALFLGLILLLNLSQGMDTKMMYDYSYTCGIVWCAELLADWLKHAFITKFNFIQSHIYSEYALLLAGDVTGIGHEGLNLDYSHAVVKRIGFAQFPLVCVMLRMLREASKYYFKYDQQEISQHKYAFGLTLASTSLLFWICLLLIKVTLGIYLQKNCLSKLHSALASTASTSTTTKSKSQKTLKPTVVASSATAVAVAAEINSESTKKSQ